MIYEQRSIRRTYELDVVLEAIVPKDTGLGFNCAADLVWQWILKVRTKDGEQSDGDLPGNVRRVGDSVFATAERGMKDSPGAVTP